MNKATGTVKKLSIDTLAAPIAAFFNGIGQ